MCERGPDLYTKLLIGALLSAETSAKVFPYTLILILFKKKNYYAQRGSSITLSTNQEASIYMTKH